MAQRRTARRRGHPKGRASQGRAKRSIAQALLGLLAALVLVALATLAYLLLVYPRGAAPGRGREVRVTIDAGTTLDGLARELAAAGAIEDARTFAAYARILAADEHLRRGEILLTDDLTPRDVLARIAIGFGASRVRVVVPEGFDRFAIAARLARWGVCTQEDFLAASVDRALLDELEIEGPSAEGYLFPDTYQLAQDTPATEVVRALVHNWRRRAEPVLMGNPEALAWLESELSWGPHEALVLASIVEKEAVVEDERPIIARVFMNRLRSPTFTPKRLQADPTVSYGCRARPELAPSCAGFDGRITRAMLQDRANPYNTYRHEGLPPGPISNPGLASLRAVVAGEAHEYLYFVARGHGRHTFSATLEEHNAAVARLRARQ